MKYVFDVKDVHEARFIGHKPKLWKMEEEHKPWMFDKAEELLSRSEYDKIVCLGDLVDDWDQEKKLGLYSETFDALERFINRHPNFLLCYGNHDVSYIWEARESGYSDYARRVVIEGLSKLEKCVSAGNIAYIHRIDNVLFSHSGLTEVFVSLFLPDFSGGIDELIEKINGFRRDELWCDASPIWARPQDGRIEMYPKLLVDYMKDMDRECVYVLNFDNAMRQISFHLTSMGGSNYAPVDPANIFKRAMLTNASFIMVMHVHPGGSLKPSSADIQSTEKISMLGNFLHIPVRDHLIVAGGTGEYISLKAEMPDIFHEIPDCSVAEPGQLKEQPEEQHTEHTTDQAATEQGTAESAAEKSITEQAKTEETPQHVAEQSQPYDPLALTLEHKEILFVKETPEAMELAKALESLGNENAGYTPKENDLVRKEWLLNTAQDIKDGNTATIIKAVSDMSETTENIAVTKKAVGFLIKLDAVKGKWEPAPKEVKKLFERKESSKPEKAADPKKIQTKDMTFSQKLESAQKKADTINAARKHSLQL